MRGEERNVGGWFDPATRRYYEERANAYAGATIDVPMERLRRALAERLPQGARILDLGCGAGRDMRGFAANGFRVTGLDLSVHLCRLAARISGSPAVCANFLETPFDPGAFEAVWASGSLLHLSPERLEDGLREVRRVLRRGGMFLCTFKRGSGWRRDAQGRLEFRYEPEVLVRSFRTSGLIVDRIDESHDSSRDIDWLAVLGSVEGEVDDRDSGARRPVDQRAHL